MKKILSYGIVLVVLLGSVGLPLYKHTCMHDNVTINTLFVSSDHCNPEEHVEKQDKHKDCCAPVEKEVVEDGCCSESMSLLSVSFNFFQQIELSAFIAPEIQRSADYYLKIIPVTAVEKQVLYSANNDPPKPGGKQLLKQNCIWRI